MKCREEGDSDKRSKSLEKVLRFECLSIGFVIFKTICPKNQLQNCIFLLFHIYSLMVVS